MSIFRAPPRHPKQFHRVPRSYTFSTVQYARSATDWSTQVIQVEADVLTLYRDFQVARIKSHASQTHDKETEADIFVGGTLRESLFLSVSDISVEINMTPYRGSIPPLSGGNPPPAVARVEIKSLFRYPV